MDIPWGDLQLLLTIAEAGSLSAAARRLRVAQPTISRRLAELESSLREPLFVRRVDGVALTPFGEGLLEPARRMAEWAAEATRVAERAETKPHGVVRITAAPGFAASFLVPFAVHLRSKLPSVQLEVVASVQYLDLSRREADLALRLQQPPQRDLVTLLSLELDVALFASPDYAARLPRGAQLADLDWIAWAPPLDHLAPNPQLAALIPDFRPTFASDDYLVQLRAAERGLGALVLARMQHRFLPDTLVELPVQLGPLRSSLHLVAARSALDIPRVRAVADLLTRELQLAQPRARRASRSAG